MNRQLPPRLRPLLCTSLSEPTIHWV